MLENTDPRAHELLQREIAFRSRTLDLVPSDNHPSSSVLETADYPLFYSENDGRNYYYPGCETIADVRAPSHISTILPSSASSACCTGEPAPSR